MQGSPKKLTGKAAEALAANYLRDQGVTIVAENFATAYGEIDLIGRETNTLVFIEVKFRSKPYYGSAAEQVTTAKQARIVQTANIYLQQQRLADKITCRFDVVAIYPEVGVSKSLPYRVEWLRNAFNAI